MKASRTIKEQAAKKHWALIERAMHQPFRETFVEPVRVEGEAEEQFRALEKWHFKKMKQWQWLRAMLKKRGLLKRLKAKKK